MVQYQVFDELFLIAYIGLYVPLMLASESFDKNNIDRRVEYVEHVFVLEMAHKTKTTLKRAQQEKIKRENAERAKVMKERGKGKDKEVGRKRKEKFIEKEEGKGLKGGTRVLREIWKYQSSTNYLHIGCHFNKLSEKFPKALGPA